MARALVVSGSGDATAKLGTRLVAGGGSAE